MPLEKQIFSVIYYNHVTAIAGSNCPLIPAIKSSTGGSPEGFPLFAFWLNEKNLWKEGKVLMDKIALAVISFIAAVLAEVIKSEEE